MLIAHATHAQVYMFHIDSRFASKIIQKHPQCKKPAKKWRLTYGTSPRKDAQNIEMTSRYLVLEKSTASLTAWHVTTHFIIYISVKNGRR